MAEWMMDRVAGGDVLSVDGESYSRWGGTSEVSGPAPLLGWESRA